MTVRNSPSVVADRVAGEVERGEFDEAGQGPRAVVADLVAGEVERG
jgi:hypothetical protein